MPAFGTCAGMIILAAEILDGRADQHRFGAIDISVRRNAFGRQRDSFEADLDVSGLERTVARGVHPRPGGRTGRPGVEVLATVRMADGAGRPSSAAQGPVLVSSFHPELADDPRLHELFLQEPDKTRKENVRAF